MRHMYCDSLGSVRLIEAVDPTVQAPTDVVVRVRATTVCGSDVHLVQGHLPTPWGFALGHEYVGEVVAVGDAVTRVAVGDRVVGPAAPWCGSCGACRRGQTQRCERGGVLGSGAGWGGWGGTMAELLRVPWADMDLSRVPDGVTDAQALTVGDVLSTGWTAVRQAVTDVGQVVVVLGCGPVGLSAVHTATLHAPRAIVAVDAMPDRLDVARALGATHVLEAGTDVAAAVAEISGGVGADAVVEAVGLPVTLALACDVVATGGRIGVVGIPAEPVPLPFAQLLFKNVTLWTGLGDLRHMDELLRFIADGRLNPSPMFTATRPFDEIEQAYVDMEQRAPGVIKTLVTVP